MREEQKKEDLLEKSARESGAIIYSGNIFKTEYRPRLILREGTSPKGNSVYIVLYKYIIDEKPQEVVIGTTAISTKKEDIVKVISYVERQIEENSQSQDKEYPHFLELLDYINQKNVQFDFTLEGKDIIGHKGEETIRIRRTILADERGNLQNRYDEEALKKIQKNQVDSLDEYIEEKRKEDKWSGLKGVIFRGKSKEEIDNFLKAEQIAEKLEGVEIVLGDNRKTVERKKEAQRKIAVEYLLDTYHNDDQGEREEAKFALIRAYAKLKEQAIAEQAITELDAFERAAYNKINWENSDEVEKQSSIIKQIANFKSFFRLLSQGREANSRTFATKIQSINFEALKRILGQSEKDGQEMQTYLDLKRDMIEEIKDGNIEQHERKCQSVRKQYEFLLRSRVRDSVREKEEHLVAGVFKHYKKEIIVENQDIIEDYNIYAKKNGKYVCEYKDEPDVIIK